MADGSAPTRYAATNIMVVADMEMTGPNPQDHYPLEISLRLVTTHDMNEIAHYHSLIHLPHHHQVDLREGSFSSRYHAELIQQARACTKTLRQVEDEILVFMGRFIFNLYQERHRFKQGEIPEYPILTGGGISKDKGFIAAHWPRWNTLLSPHVIDVTSIMEFARRCFPHLYHHQPRKTESVHRAAYDSAEVLTLLRFYHIHFNHQLQTIAMSNASPMALTEPTPMDTYMKTRQQGLDFIPQQPQPPAAISAAAPPPAAGDISMPPTSGPGIPPSQVIGAGGPTGPGGAQPTA